MKHSLSWTSVCFRRTLGKRSFRLVLTSLSFVRTWLVNKLSHATPSKAPLKGGSNFGRAPAGNTEDRIRFFKVWMLNPKVRPWVALSLADPDRRCGTKFSCDFLKCKTYRAKLGIFFSYPPSRADKLTYNAGAPNEKILLQVSEVFLRHKCLFQCDLKVYF